ncbi:MAG: FtsW/RodA/SpoVE family cell cycle protein [Clostridiales bacterium]|nr:FtsW/RodA/SpoVE family cell cycle protein [Clostridiales bacterium]
MRTRVQGDSRRLTLPGMLFFFLGFLLLGLQTPDYRAFMLAVLVPLAFYLVTAALLRLLSADRVLLCLVNFLCALGILALYRLNPARGLGQTFNYAVGLLGMVGCMLLVRFWQRFRWTLPLIALAALVLMALPLMFGTVKNGAKAWVSLLGVSFQPSEIVKVAMVLVMAFLLSRRMVLLALAFAGVCLGLLFLQRDLGTALLYYAISLVLVYVSTGSLTFLALGTLGAGAGAVLGYQMNTYVQNRVSIWQNPWQDPYGIAWQVVQSLVAMVNAGPWGTGLGLGNARTIPEVETDFIFAAVFHEFGLVFGILVILIYLLIFLRGVGVARRARTRFHTLLALGCSCFIALQTFVIIGGNINLIPLTGVTLPFMSYGGTSLVSSLCIMGLLQGVANANEHGLEEDQLMALMGEEDG